MSTTRAIRPSHSLQGRDAPWWSKKEAALRVTADGRVGYKARTLLGGVKSRKSWSMVRRISALQGQDAPWWSKKPLSSPADRGADQLQGQDAPYWSKNPGAICCSDPSGISLQGQHPPQWS